MAYNSRIIHTGTVQAGGSQVSETEAEFQEESVRIYPISTNKRKLVVEEEEEEESEELIAKSEEPTDTDTKIPKSKKSKTEFCFTRRDY